MECPEVTDPCLVLERARHIPLVRHRPNELEVSRRHLGQAHPLQPTILPELQSLPKTHDVVHAREEEALRLARKLAGKILPRLASPSPDIATYTAAPNS